MMVKAKALTPSLRFQEFWKEWKFERIGNISSKVGSGSTPRGGSEVYTEEGIPFIRSQNVNNNSLIQDDLTYIPYEIHKKMIGSRVRPNDILLNITGASLGRSCVVPQNFEDGNVNQHVCIIRLKEGFVPEFINAKLSSFEGQKLIFSMQAGGGREGLNFQSIRSIKLPLPSLPEQRKIAAFLSAVDKRIAQQRKQVELLTTYKKGVMQQIFSRQIRFKDEEGKEFPEWEEKKLGEVTKKFSKRNKDLIDAEVYSVTNTSGFIKQTEHFDKIVAGSDLSTYKIVRGGDFAYNPARINVGSIAQFDGEICLISSLYVCFSAEESVIDLFLTYFFQLEKTKHYFNTYGEGGVRIYLWYELFARIKIMLPSLPEQQKIATFLSTIDRKIDQAQAKLEKLEEFKKGLLQGMFV